MKRAAIEVAAPQVSPYSLYFFMVAYAPRIRTTSPIAAANSPAIVADGSP